MKKIWFFAHDLNIGGIERALIALLNKLDYKKYDVTLVLEKKEGVLIDKIPSYVKIKEYCISNSKISLFRKIINRLKLIKTIIFNYHKYDFACCYVPYSIPGSILVKYMSNNNCFWIHSDYYYLYNKDVNDIKNFFDKRGISKFKYIIFLANEARDNFITIYPNLKKKTVICSNLIDYEQILVEAKEKINEKKPHRPLFINISRHEEHAKKLARLIRASKKLVDGGYNFEVWMIGSGNDTSLYEKLIKELKLENNVKLIGQKKNPYPYYKIADSYVLTSEYEGFPVVYLESLIFNLPIITTIDISSKHFQINNQFGIIADKNETSIYECMKAFLDKNYRKNNSFDPVKYNNDVYKDIEALINNRSR